MPKYNPTHCKYARYHNMILATHKNQAVRDKSQDDVRGEIGGPLSEDLQLSNFVKTVKEAKYC